MIPQVKSPLPFDVRFEDLLDDFAWEPGRTESAVYFVDIHGLADYLSSTLPRACATALLNSASHFEVVTISERSAPALKPLSAPRCVLLKLFASQHCFRLSSSCTCSARTVASPRPFARAPATSVVIALAWAGLRASKHPGRRRDGDPPILIEQDVTQFRFSDA